MKTTSLHARIKHENQLNINNSPGIENVITTATGIGFDEQKASAA